MENSKLPDFMDPLGYFIIQIKENKIYVGFCKYQSIHHKGGFTKNKVEDEICTDSEKEILYWAKQYISLKSHEKYLIKEIEKALHAIKHNSKYIQE